MFVYLDQSIPKGGKGPRNSLSFVIESFICSFICFLRLSLRKKAMMYLCKKKTTMESEPSIKMCYVKLNYIRPY